MSSLVGRRVVVTLLALLGGLTAGCLQPTLPPLPPPEAPNVTAPVDGEVQVSGSLPIEDASFVLVWNHGQGGSDDPGTVVGQRMSGRSYRFRLPAQSGDVLELWYLAGGSQSDGAIAEVPEAEQEADAGDAGASE